MPHDSAPGRRPLESAPDTLVADSCGFTWLFDLRRQRFRRVPRGASLTVPAAPGAWVAYHRLDLGGDSACIAVVLNPEGTRILRSWLHVEPCRHCRPGPSGKESLTELQERVERWRAETGAVDRDGGRESGSYGWVARARRPSRTWDRRRDGSR